jgi:hypothetical protein
MHLGFQRRRHDRAVRQGRPGFEWRGVNPHFRSNITFGYVYWTNMEVRDMIIDLETRLVYSTVPQSGIFTPVVAYNFYPSAVICTNNGLYPLEITDLREASIQQFADVRGVRDQLVASVRCQRPVRPRLHFQLRDEPHVPVL